MIKKLLSLTVIMLFLSLGSASGQDTRHEISIGYGYYSITDWGLSYSEVMDDILIGKSSVMSCWGSVSAEYSYRVFKSIFVGASFTYSSYVNKIDGDAFTINTYRSITPQMKIYLFNHEFVSMYSRFGVGVSFAQSKGQGLEGSRYFFAFQMSPIGIEVGGKTSGYIEIGLGNAGFLMAGVRYKF